MKFLPAAILMLISITGTAQEKKSIKRGDVVINEVMPTPKNNELLPNIEWFELFNCSDSAINMQDLRWCEKQFETYVLQPQSYIVVCPKKNKEEIAGYCSSDVISTTTWKAITDAGCELTLTNTQGTVIDYLNYTPNLYNDTKSEGKSLERIDAYNICADEHDQYKPSTDDTGATMGLENSVRQRISCTDGPSLESAYIDDDRRHVTLNFDKPIETSTFPRQIKINGEGIRILEVKADPTTLKSIDFYLFKLLNRNTIYNAELNNISCLSGNKSENIYFKLAISQTPHKGDVVINEIMSTSKDSRTDYIEIAPLSVNPINLHELEIVTYNSNGIQKSRKPLAYQKRAGYKGDYYVVCKNLQSMLSRYPDTDKKNYIELEQMPQLTAEGAIVLVNKEGEILDSAAYYKDMWGYNITDIHDVALERKNELSPSTDSNNWTGANGLATDNGYIYGTPGAKNSVFSPITNNNEAEDNNYERVEVVTRTFGLHSLNHDCEAVIKTRFYDGDWSATATIYTPKGFPLITLLNNVKTAGERTITWNGRNDVGETAPPGTYIFYLQAWNTDGKKIQFKTTLNLTE